LIHSTTNVIAAAASKNVAANGPGGGSISESGSVTVGALSAQKQTVVNNFGTAAGIPSGTLSDFTAAKVSAMAQAVSDGAQFMGADPATGVLTFQDSNGQQRTFSPADHQVAKAEALSNAGGPGSPGDVGGPGGDL
jgi:hypothetical protein